ncbi:MAG: tryptophan--tRNA ligase [Alphaproteobacteria bacterium]|nr:tryptophan--tRNA ligase [Alphaproteobacteria bacterium]MCB9695305.1 tryptophan--tRNA ligase [Alphaproteobacteria bacterium]
MKKVSLTGIKPTAQPHIGNWLGMHRPSLELAADPSVSAYYFVADYHALTTIRDPAELRRLTIDVAAVWLAFGLDPARTLVYRQSDVPEVFELSWILACFSPKGFMNKAHAYKAARDVNVAKGDDEDAGVNMGLYTYPILMAADILIVDADVVPVGQDQVQHVEMARDMAQRFNHTYGAEVLKLPTALVRGESGVVPGVDGRKMSKSYGNTLPCFSTAKQLRKAVMRIETDSTPPEAPKDPESSLVYKIHRALLTKERAEDLAAEYRSGISWGAAKQLLAEDLEALLAEPRAKYDELMRDPSAIEDILDDGARRVRGIAAPVLARVRAAVGVR